MYVVRWSCAACGRSNKSKSTDAARVCANRCERPTTPTRKRGKK